MMDIIIYFLHHTVQDRYSEKDITLVEYNASTALSFKLCQSHQTLQR